MAVFGAKIKCGAAALLIPVVCALMGEVRLFAVAFAALSLHEAAHALLTRALGYRVHSIELLPFGFVAKLEGNIPRWDELVISAAGPLFSLIVATVCVAMGSVLPLGEVVQEFVDVNFSIAIVNLIPVKPLDGGRILACMVKLYESGPGERVFRVVGLILSAALLAAGVLLSFSGNVTLLVMGLFLLIQNFKREGEELHIEKALSRAGRVRRSGHTRARYLVVDGQMSLEQALRLVGSDDYTVLLVLDGNMRVLGQVDEGKLMDAVTRMGAQVALSKLVM